MSRNPPRLPDYLEHILEAIDRIKRYTNAQDLQVFKDSEMVQEPVGLEDRRLQNGSAGPFFTDFLGNSSTIARRNRQKLSSPGPFFAIDAPSPTGSQDAVIRNLEVIGEAGNNIVKHYPEFAAAHPELPLAFAYRMRNAIAHGYFKVDVDVVWQTIHRDLPGLYTRIRAAHASIADHQGRKET